MIAIGIAVVVSWLVGSIPGAYIMCRVMKGEDIRTLGSGNAGATNAYRVLGLKGAIPALLVDVTKGFLPVFLVLHSGYDFQIPTVPVALLAGAAAFVGHLFPVYIGFRGGKGVATGAGIMTAFQPLLFPACLGVFLPVLLVTRKMSLASLCAAVSLPLWYTGIAFLNGGIPDPYILVFTVLIAVLVFVRHRKNISNLIGGTEKPLY